MKPGLAIGLEHALRQRVRADKTVPSLYPEAPEFRAMPRVLATGFLVGLLEWSCMRAIEPWLEPHELSLGTHIDTSHCAATPPGLVVTTRSRLVGIDGRRLAFEVEAHDGVDLIARGRHERCVVARESFELRIGRKAGHDSRLTRSVDGRAATPATLRPTG